MGATARRTFLIATDADEVFDEVDAALGDATTAVVRVHTGREVLPAVLEVEPDLVILDLQIGNMGGVAASLALRNEESADRIAPQNVLILLDRVADVFITRRGGADGWLVKPLNPLRLRRAATAVLDGGSYTEGEAAGQTATGQAATDPVADMAGSDDGPHVDAPHDEAAPASA